MWKVVAVCSALLMFGAPAMAQTTQSDNNNNNGAGGWFFPDSMGPGGTLLVVTGAGLAAWGIYKLAKKSNSCTSAC